MVKAFFCVAAAFMMFTGLAAAQPAPPRTTAEASDYKSTTRYADVVTFCEGLTKLSPSARLDWFGVTAEGRKLPLIVLADPMVNSPEAARRLGQAGRVARRQHPCRRSGRQRSAAHAGPRRGHWRRQSVAKRSRHSCGADLQRRRQRAHRQGQAARTSRPGGRRRRPRERRRA